MQWSTVLCIDVLIVILRWRADSTKAKIV